MNGGIERSVYHSDCVDWSGSNQVNPNGSISTALVLVVLTNIRLGQNGPAKTNSLAYTIALLNADIKSLTDPVL